MRNNAPNILFFILIAVGFYFLWTYGEKNWFQQKPAAETAKKQTPEEAKKQEEAKKAKAEEDKRKAKEAAARRREHILANRPTLIALGDSTFFNQVLLSTRGGGVQQLILPRFDEADRLARAVMQKDADGNTTKTPVPLYLIPGKPTQRGQYLREPFTVPELQPGVVADPFALTEPSFTLFHYPKPDANYPDPELGERNWDAEPVKTLEGGAQQLTFKTRLGEPYFVEIRKTYTLAPKDYHIGLKIEIEKLRVPGSLEKGQPLRLQLTGARGLPIEGEWYTNTYRVGVIGWLDQKGAARRQYEDAATIGNKLGGEKVDKGQGTFKYMAVANQYFASAVAIDDTAEGAAKNPWAYVRATTELPLGEKQNPNTPYFDDITVRAACDTLDLAPGEKVTHSYLLYNGPAKVSLLGLMEGNMAVDPQLVERYRDKLGLKTITDFRSDTWLGRFANAIYWTDLVIAFTNIMHWLLAMIYKVIPGWAMSIIVLTVFVRLLLIYPSKRVTRMNMRMMEVQKRLAPQLEELKKQFADDPHMYNRAKMQLMMRNGVNPFAALGGCFLLLAQMPVMMGLYFCLQESVFFRLEPFLWVNNLAAPDMTLWWGEKIPFISTPEDIGSFYYLGPYLNILPLIAVALMIWQQKKMMPPPTDDQMAAQQRMMKWMMIIIAVMFYKVAAGLALYFIIGTVWGLLERRLIKPDPAKLAAADSKTDTVQTSVGPVAVPKPLGLFGRLKEAMKKRMEEMQKQADEMAKRRIHNKKDPPASDNNPNPGPHRRDKKKKRRK